MTKVITIRQAGWTITKYALAALVVLTLISQGMHPVWAILLIIYRKAVIRVCLILGALIWLTQSIM